MKIKYILVLFALVKLSFCYQSMYSSKMLMNDYDFSHFAESIANGIHILYNKIR